MRGRREQQIHRFVQGEKVAPRRRIGDCDWASQGDLLGKDLGHAVSRSQNVTQAQDRAARVEYNLFSDPLGGAHDRSWFDRFISGEQYHPRPMRGRRPDQGLGTEDVVGHGCQRMRFHERYMLEGGGMEDDARLVSRENLIQQRTVGHIAQDGGHGAGSAGFSPLAVEMVEMALRGL